MDPELLKIRHKKSLQDFPHLNLDEDEFVELEFVRATICTVLIWIVAAFAATLIVVFLAIFNSSAGANLLMPGVDASGIVNSAGVIFIAIVGLAALISTKVFRGNKLYVTNKRAIQYIMISLFGSSVNIIDLNAIEDVSFHQSGIFEYVFGTGTIRMSTVGDETTYTFKMAYKPSPKEMQMLTRLVSGAKGKGKKE